ncbi:OprD family outer membrane porin [Luteibacter aegosomatissinici]|uniref:OprD family outer membrane porin n=1 Tax=Luteibacter aegosomatissinici TaxID=2911539 RepID=UPI001FFBB05D|nr:OprD family outer membrane porin [Luteibacter aegosomatissinici]UPG94229.1 OprD family porin [Luteibacter aegosomatissinici]
MAGCLAVGLACIAGGAHADDFFRDATVSGEVRLYRFDRNYDNPSSKDQFANSLAGLLTVKSGKVGGFSLVATGFSAHSFGTQSNDAGRVDTSLMGPGNVIDGITQAYAEYTNPWVTVRGGDQYLNTPWMGQSDSRIIPASYQGAMADFKPAKGWDIYAIRTLRWKSRTSESYNDDNVYYPSTYHGDSMYGNNGSLPASARSQGGTTAIGSTYAGGGLAAQAWYYDFEHFGRLGYADGMYTIPTGTMLKPFVGAQLVRETSGSDNVIVDTQTKITGLAGERVDAKAWGVDAGVGVGKAKFDISYNKLASDTNAAGAGAIISPYTNSYATDPLYTTSMLRGLVELGAGHAWKARAQYNFLHDDLQLIASYAHYDTVLRGTSHDVYVDIVWKLDMLLKGLQLRDRWEHTVGGNNNLNPGNQPWTNNRLMLSYKF